MIISFGDVTLTVYDWLIREPIRGPWSGRVTVAQAFPAVEGSAVTLDGWSGSVVRRTAVGELAELELIGGSGKLDALTIARQYGPVSLGSIVSDLCGDAGEVAGSAIGDLGAWRSRGKRLRAELTRLSEAWRIGDDGAVTLDAPSGDAEAPGAFVRAYGEARIYACDRLLPLAGKTLEGYTIELAVFSRGTAAPRVTVWPLRPAPVADPDILGGTITSLSGGRVSVILDDGTELTDVPLFSAAGYAPEGADGVRCLVIDVGDARNTIALVGADGTIDELALASGRGTVLRSGDKILIAGLQSAAPGSPVVSPPAAVTISIDPTITSPGDPGTGYSRVKA